MWPGKYRIKSLTRTSIDHLLARQVSLLNAALSLIVRLIIQENIAPDNLTSCQVAVFDPLAHIVFVDRLTKVAKIIRRDLLIHSGFWCVFGDV